MATFRVLSTSQTPSLRIRQNGYSVWVAFRGGPKARSNLPSSRSTKANGAIRCSRREATANGPERQQGLVSAHAAVIAPKPEPLETGEDVMHGHTASRDAMRRVYGSQQAKVASLHRCVSSPANYSPITLMLCCTSPPRSRANEKLGLGLGSHRQGRWYLLDPTCHRGNLPSRVRAALAQVQAASTGPADVGGIEEIIVTSSRRQRMNYSRKRRSHHCLQREQDGTGVG